MATLTHRNTSERAALGEFEIALPSELNA